MDFNERTVVDFPKGEFKYNRRPTKVAKRLKEADRDRVEAPLKTLSGTDHQFLNHISRILDDLLDTFFLLTVNASLLAIAIHHLRLTKFFLVNDGVLTINKNFVFEKENYLSNEGLMKSTLIRLIVKHEFSDPKSDNYEKYIIKTIAGILRYQRFLVRYFNVKY